MSYAEARFRKFLKHVQSCWLWSGALNSYGYGTFREDKKRILAHRWSYQHFVGPIPAGREIDHLCRNRNCVNPDHLEPVTRRVNVQRGLVWKREQTHCKNGHQWTVENTRWERSRYGLYRHCKICDSILHKIWEKQNRERRNKSQRQWRASRK
jgi:hypothetical protein